MSLSLRRAEVIIPPGAVATISVAGEEPVDITELLPRLLAFEPPPSSAPAASSGTEEAFIEVFLDDRIKVMVSGEELPRSEALAAISSVLRISLYAAISTPDEDSSAS